MFQVLEHIYDVKDFIEASLKVLKKGGKIIVCEPGRGHARAESSLRAVAEYGVNERDMPPSLSRRQLRAAGFVQVKTYAYPALAHRMLYAGGGKGLAGIIRSNAIRRAIGVGLITSVLKSWHGIVTAEKP